MDSPSKVFPTMSSKVLTTPDSTPKHDGPFWCPAGKGDSGPVAPIAVLLRLASHWLRCCANHRVVCDERSSVLADVGFASASSRAAALCC